MTPEKVNTPEQVRPIKKLFIATRGEIAARAARACLEREKPIPAVVPYSLEDEDALIVDIALNNIRNGWEIAPIGGRTQEESYANPKRMLETAMAYNCDAIFLGYGFLSENAEFIAQCEKEGIRVLAPPSAVIDIAGNKIKARAKAKEIRFAGGRLNPIPILEGTGNLETVEQAVRAAHHFGYPHILKDPNGGGGKGNLIVRNEEELRAAHAQIKTGEEAQVFMERYIQNAAHVEIQIAADRYGNVITLGERDCTMQRKSQKIIEESPSPILSEKTRRIMQFDAKLFAKEIGYEGVGTVEFIVNKDKLTRNGDPEWYFMEVNPRIQVEHCVTEEQTGVDIVGLMIDIAEGRKLSITQQEIDERLKHAGHTIEARVYAEDPNSRNFDAAKGEVAMDLPADDVRIETGLKPEGDKISPYYDNTVYKAIAHAPTREEAIAKLTAHLAKAKITGIPTNKEMTIELLKTEEFKTGQSTTTFIEKWWQNRIKERAQSIAEFINSGNFTPYKPSFKLDTAQLPPGVPVFNQRKSKMVTYEEHLAEERAKTGKESAAEFGIWEHDGRQAVLYYLDYDFFAGTFGVAEGLALEDARELAREKGLPLITISSSGGARQEEGIHALAQMETTVYNLKRFPPLFHINIYAGPVYGGVPASFAGAAGLQLIIDSELTKLGFTGPFPVAKTEGKEPASSKAKDAYAVLEEGAHTPKRHYKNRTIDVIVPTMAQGSDLVTHMLHVLNIPSTITDPHIAYYHKELAKKTGRLERPRQIIRNLFGKVEGVLWERHKSPATGEILLPPVLQYISNVERMEILENPQRPTAGDFIDPKFGVFDDAVFLTGEDRNHNIIAAITRIGDRSYMVIGQQARKMQNPHTKRWERIFDPQTPADWEYEKRMVVFAEKINKPIIFLIESMGGDCTTKSEDRNQGHEISSVFASGVNHKRMMLSAVIGPLGSGGGKGLGRKLDGAIMLENALGFVSSFTVQYWIRTGKWIDQNSSPEDIKELNEYINKQTGSTAEAALKALQIDEIIPEGKGGAQQNPQLVASLFKDWIIRQSDLLYNMPPEQLQARRDQRVKEVSKAAAIPNL